MTEQRVSDEEVRRTAEAAEVMFGAGHYDPLVTRTKTVYDCSLMALDLLDARARVKELEEALRLVVKQTEEWNRSVEAIIGRQPKTGIDLEAVNRALRGEEAGE